tara:strand:+ start:5965 stop:6912 length:948 start_codon:yes stop_codon:yes gene_type:complete
MPILTNLKKDNFEDILLNYPLGNYKSHKHLDWALANTVYLLKTTKGNYILKIFEESEEKDIKYQVKIIDYLTKKKIKVATVLKLKNKKEILHYKDKYITIQKYLDGSHPKKFNKALMKDLAREFSLMNKHLLKLKLKEKTLWPNDHQFKPDLKNKYNITEIDIKEEENTLLKQLKAINKKNLRKSIIHSDLHDVNLLIKNNKLIAILDWDDSHEDYLSYEIAVFLVDIFAENPINKEKIKEFFKEYQKHLKLKEEEKKAVYYFIKKRFLSIIFWYSKQRYIHKDRKQILNQQRKAIIKGYLNFKKLTLEEFLELC